MKKKLLSMILCLSLLISTFSTSLVAIATGGETVPQAEVVEILDKQLNDGHIRIGVITEDTIATGTTLSGNIYVNGEVSSTASLYKYDSARYAVFLSGVTTGTIVKLTGVYTAGDKKVEFVEVKFKYNGAHWDYTEEDITEVIPKATVTQVLDKQLNDGNIRTSVTSTDTIAVGTTLAGTIYVNGEPSTAASLYKYDAARYAVFVTGAVAGMTVQLSGVYTAGDKKVEFNPINFVYDGTKWTLYQKEANLTAVANQGKTIVLAPDADGSFGNTYYAPLYGGVYVDGECVYIPPQKAAPYYYYWEANITGAGLTIQEGLILTIDCVVGTETDAVRFKKTSFRFDGANWQNYMEPPKDAVEVELDVTGQSDTSIWLNASPQDNLPYDGEAWSWQYTPLDESGLYVNGTRYAVPLVKTHANTYLIPAYTLGFEVEDGTEVTIKGYFCNKDGKGIKVKDVTIVYNGEYGVWENPNSDREIYRKNVKLDVTGQSDDSIWLKVSPKDELPHDGEKWSYQYRPIAGAGLFVNGTRYATPLVKTHEDTYLLPQYMLGFEVEDGTEVTIKGFFCDNSGNGIMVEELTVVYNKEYNTWENPNSDREIYRKNVKLDVTGQSDTSIWLNASPKDELPHDNIKWSYQYRPIADAGLFVGGTRYAVPLIKVHEDTYLIPNDGSLGFEVKDGVEVIIKGFFCDQSGNGIIVEEMTIVYDDEYQAWTNPNSDREIYRKNVKLDVTGQSDTSIWLNASPKDELPHDNIKWSYQYRPIAGAGLFVNGKRYAVPLIKVHENTYLIPNDGSLGFEVKDGVKVVIKGFFCDNRGNGIMVDELTIVYNGKYGAWENPNSGRRIYRQNVTMDVRGEADSSLWLYTSPVDKLPYANDWTCMYQPTAEAGFFVNGTRYAVPLIKVWADMYLIPSYMMGFDIKDGMEVVIKGYFCDNTGDGIIIEGLTVVWDEASKTWIKVGTKINSDEVTEDGIIRIKASKMFETDSETDDNKVDDDKKTDTAPQQSNNKLFIIIGIIAVAAAIGVGGILIWRKQRRRDKE